MAKKIYRLRDWSGGLNTFKEPGELKDNELVTVYGLDVSITGRIRQGYHFFKSTDYWEADTNAELLGTTYDHAHPGYGLAIFPVSQNASGHNSDHVVWTGVSDGCEPLMHYINDSNALTATSAGSTNIQSGLTNTTANDIDACIQLRADDFSSAINSINVRGVWLGLSFYDNDGTANEGKIIWGNLIRGAKASGVDEDNVKPIITSTGKGFYAVDSNFANGSNYNRIAYIPIERTDFPNATNTPAVISNYIVGPAVLELGSAQGPGDGVNNFDHDVSGNTAADGNGECYFHFLDTGTGDWDGTYSFYLSLLYDDVENPHESNLEYIIDDSPAGESMRINASLKHTASNPVLGNHRINGFRVYWTKEGEPNYLFYTIDFRKGLQVSGEEDWHALDDSGTATVFTMASNLDVSSPPTFQTYKDINGYDTEDIPEYLGDSTSSSGTFGLRYRTACIASDGRMYAGNLKYNGESHPSKMVFSEVGRPGVLPVDFEHTIEIAGSGSPIVHLEVAGDTLFQFRNDSVLVLNTSTDSVVVENIYYHFGGIADAHQVCSIPNGVAFANNLGIFVYTRGEFKNIISEKMGDQLSSYMSALPSIGYHSLTKDLVYLKSVGTSGDEASSTGLKYNFKTKALTQSYNILDTGTGPDVKYSNFSNDRYGNLYTRELLTGTDAKKYTRDHFAFSGGQGVQVFKTGRLSLGSDGYLKKIIEIRFFVTGNSDSNDSGANLNGLSMASDIGSGSLRVLSTARTEDTSGNLGGSSPSATDGYIRFYPNFEFKKEFRKCRWIQLYLQAVSGPEVDFSIDEIQIVYKDLNRP